MSKKIKIVAQLKELQRVIRFEYQAGLPFFAFLSEALVQEGVGFSLCGGNGICGKCRIRFVNHAPMPELMERKYLTAEELRQGVRLACMTKPVRDCEIEVLFIKKTMVLTAYIPPTKPETMLSNLKCNQRDKHVDTKEEKEYLLAADVGTTTIAMALAEKGAERNVDTYTCMNPQQRYGADVISRITAAREVGGLQFQRMTAEVLYKGAEQLKKSGAVSTDKIYIAANTTMNHFLWGSDAACMGQEPFVPEFLGEKEVEFRDYRLVLLPGISAFVGGDITAGLLSCGMLPVCKENRGNLFLDLGTNGEMVLCDGEKLYCTSAAAGPAFEGKNKKHGSHTIHILAELLRLELMDETGLLRRERIEELGDNGSILQELCEISQQEVRALQMAKAAVRTGIDVLLQKAGMTLAEIERVWLAGGFGYFIKVEDAVRIGLLTEELQKKTVAIGNTALQGALLYGSMMQPEREIVEVMLRNDCITVNLAKEEYFVENFIKHMNFEK